MIITHWKARIIAGRKQTSADFGLFVLTDYRGGEHQEIQDVERNYLPSVMPLDLYLLLNGYRYANQIQIWASLWNQIRTWVCICEKNSD